MRALERRDALVRWSRRLAILLVLAAISFAAHRGYVSWRKNHLTAQLQAFVRQNEYASAVLVARHLLVLDPNYLPACRAMAEMAENSGRAEAVVWRKKIVQLTPGVIENQLALARSATRFNHLELAEAVLEHLPANARNGVAYHQIAAALAFAQKDLPAAENHFAAALQTDPQNSQLALNLALIRLTSSNAETAKQSRASLERLTAEPGTRLPALRALTAQALARGDEKNALRWSEQLSREANANFSDALLRFQSVQKTEAAAGALAELKNKAATNAATAADLITWLNRHELATVAIAWLPELPKTILQTQPVPLAIAESFSFLQDWTTLRSWVEGKNWGEFEALRLAVESHALHRLGRSNENAMETQNTWRAALRSAQKHPEQLAAVAQLAEGWGYAADAEEAWWLLANGNGNPRAGLAALQRIYKSSQDTHGLLRVARRALELNPLDLIAANNCASFGLLISSDRSARRLAAKLHFEHPANHAFAATYAYALQTEGKLAEGLQIMETLPEHERRYPAITAYYVVMLVESGQLERARAFLPEANRASLLPEEQKLLAAAARKLIPEVPGVAQN